MKYFNFKYLKENLKKSKVFVIFMLILFPILNTVMIFMSNYNNVNIYNLDMISGITIFLLYLLPILLSFILFGYVFKKKSIDFIGSMPLSKKTIFITNTIGGIILITSMFLITSILFLISDLILPNVIIPLGLIIDYFILFTLSYILMFAISNIAVSISGNKPTSIVVILLITFLIPFTSFYVSERWFNTYDKINYEETESYVRCYDDTKKYTLPSAYIINEMDYQDDTSLYNLTSIPRTIILIITYIGLGIFLFNRKELEVSETSFKTYKMHIFVKTLTFIPIMLITYEILIDGTLPAIIFMLIILLIYNFVYDMILKRRIDEIKKNTIVFLLTIIGLTVIINLIPEKEHLNLTKFNKNDIKEIYYDFEVNDIAVSKNYYDILLNGIKTYEKTHEDGYNGEYDNYVIFEYKLELNNNKKFYVDSLIPEDKYNELYQEYNKNQRELDINNNIAITALNDYVLLDNDIERLMIKDNNNIKNGLNINIYKYIDHELIRETFNSNINKELNNKVIEQINNKLLNYRDNNDIYHNNGTLSLEDMDNNYYGHMNKGTNIFINSLTKKDINYNEKIYKLWYSTTDGGFYYILNLEQSEVNKFVKW